jgi:Tfp pilus assembly protein PilF
MEREAQKGEDYYLLGKIKYESDPTNAKYVSELAKQAQVLQKNGEAVGLWLELLALIEADPQSPGYKELVKTSNGDPLSEIYTQLAAAYLLLEHYQEALKASNKAMACKIKSKEAIHIYATCEIMGGELSKAHFILEELLKTMPDYPPALYLMAVTFCLEGEEKKARDIFQLLRQKRMLLAPVLNKLARQLHACGRKNDAQRIVHATIENEIGDEETNSLIEELRKDVN